MFDIQNNEPEITGASMVNSGEIFVSYLHGGSPRDLPRPAKTSEGQKPTVLIADDDPITLKLVHRLVADMGHPVIECNNGNDALAHLVQPDGPVLAILDWSMPGMSGMEIRMRVRSERLNEHVYILMLTGRDSDEDLAHALNAGVDDYLTKPISKQVLRARIRSAARIVEREKALRELAASHKNLLRSIPSALIAINSADLVTAWNGVAAALFGIRGKDAMGQLILRLPLGWQWEAVLETLVMARDSQAQQRYDDLVVETQTGELRHYTLTVSPILDDWRRVSGVLFLLSDTTEQKNLQQQLHQSRRLEAIGELAAGIAHELNTPSQYVSDNLEFIDSGLDQLFTLNAFRQDTRVESPTDSDIDVAYLLTELPKAVQASRRGMEQISRIVSVTNRFAHPGDESFELIDLNQAVRDTVEISRGRWKQHAEIQCALDERLPVINCQRGKINQILLNLIVNAAQAIEEKGDSEIGTILITTELSDTSVRLRVRDTGGWHRNCQSG